MNIEIVKEELKLNGELHLVVEEHDAVAGDEDFIGLRNNAGTYFDDKNEVIVANDGRKDHYIGYDRVVYFEPANEFPD